MSSEIDKASEEIREKQEELKGYEKGYNEAIKKKKPKKTRKIYGVSDDDFPFEFITVDDEPKFLVYNVSTNSFSIEDSVKVRDKKVYPITKRQALSTWLYDFTNFPLDIPDNLKEYLFNAILEELRTFIFMPDTQRKVCSVEPLKSAQALKFENLWMPYVWGGSGTGKTPLLKLLARFSHRGYFGTALNSADIYAKLHFGRATCSICEDEFQGSHKKPEKFKIIKNGRDFDGSVPRYRQLGKGVQILVNFPVFCYYAMNSEELPSSSYHEGFVRRLIEIQMVEGNPKREYQDHTKEDVKRWNKIRNHVLMWKMITQNEEYSSIETPFKRTMRQKWRPLLVIVKDMPKLYDEIVGYARQEYENKIEEFRDSLNGKVVKTIAELINPSNPLEHKCPIIIPFSDIWSKFIELTEAVPIIETGGVIRKDKVRINTGEEVTHRKVTYRLKKLFDAIRKTMRFGLEVKKVWIFQPMKVSSNITKYHVNDENVTDVTDKTVSQGLRETKKIANYMVNNQENKNSKVQSVTDENIGSVTDRVEENKLNDKNNVENEEKAISPRHRDVVSSVTTVTTQATPDSQEKEPFFKECYFCGKPIMNDNWKSDGFTQNKPVHPECYKKLRSQLKNEKE